MSPLRAALVLAAACALVAATGGRARAASLPATLAPPAPFPLVLEQSLEREFVAPGVERGTYRLQTSAGPLVISIVHVDPREPSVRFGAVLAHDRIVSAGETVSSMADRTNAVAGINADYFDIGNTNAPLGLLVQNGVLERTPSTRVAFAVGRDRRVTFNAFGVRGTATINPNGTTGAAAFAVSSVNEWPPHDGAALLTPAFGAAPAAAGTVVAALTPLDTSTPTVTPPSDPGPPPSGTYRVTEISTGPPPTGSYALGLGPAVQDGLPVLPDVGDIIDIALQADPPLVGIDQAVGGGPALLSGGQAVEDPASPGYAERARRIPVAAAARLTDSDVAFVVADGRRPTVSIGLARAELIALLTGLGATDAMQFDSGGSATLVARVLGDEHVSVQNEPSDGVERSVADGIFVYSDAPVGPPARLVVRPSAVEALPDTAVPLRSSIVDAAGHALGPARGPWTVRGSGARIDAANVLHAGAAPLDTTLAVKRNGVGADLPLAIVPAPARIVIVPDRPNPDPGGSLALRAQALDARGRPIEAGDRVVWSALRGSITADGTFTAGPADGFVTATIGDVRSSEIVRVGRHRAPLPGFDPDSRPAWHFTTTPAGGPGALAFTAQGTLELSYDFRDSERAAYANAGVALGEPLAVSCAIDGDAGGAAIRAAFVDRYGERSAVTLARAIDWTGAQRRSAVVPAALAPPIVLQSFYVVGSLGTAPVKSAGTIGIRACDVTLPGTPAVTP